MPIKLRLLFSETVSPETRIAIPARGGRITQSQKMRFGNRITQSEKRGSPACR